jgi:hypothetical protein
MGWSRGERFYSLGNDLLCSQKVPILSPFSATSAPSFPLSSLSVPFLASPLLEYTVDWDTDRIAWATCYISR